MKRPLRVIATNEDIEDKRNVDRERTCFEGKFKLVAVVDVLIEIRHLRGNLYYCIRRWAFGILAPG